MKLKKSIIRLSNKLGDLKGHKLKNGQYRLFYVSLILDNSKNKLFYLCEIDMSDGKKNISTLLIPYDKKYKPNYLWSKELEVFKNSNLYRSL